jgi:hypothetical protein
MILFSLSGINHKVDLYCTLWIGAWTSSPRPSEPLYASDFVNPGKDPQGIKTEVASSGELNPCWSAAVSRPVRSHDEANEGSVPNPTVVAWLINKKLVTCKSMQPIFLKYNHCFRLLRMN